MADTNKSFRRIFFHSFLVITLFLTFIFSGCQVHEGPGGLASITGRVYAFDYNAELTTLLNEGYAGEVDVYIVYGENAVFDDDQKTHFDGRFRFDFLKKGTYTLFVYSKDSTLANVKIEYPIMKTVEITEKNQDMDLGDFVVWN